MKDYTRQLVTEEMNLGSLIERAVKQIEVDRVKEQEMDEADNAEDGDESFERSLFEEDGQSILRDQDFADFSDFEEEEDEALEDYFNSLAEED
jgi:hypothetical protein